LCGILNKPEDNGNFELKELFFNSPLKFVWLVENKINNKFNF
jgi:hypothetical protein